MVSPIVTCRSCIASRRADWTLAGARLISSARSDVGEDRALAGDELLRLRVEDERPDEVRREEVRGELDPRERGVEAAGERPHRERLGEAGHPLEENVAVGEEPDHEPLDHRPSGRR